MTTMMDDSLHPTNEPEEEWVVVPRKPTVAMLKAAGECWSRMRDVHGGATGPDYWRAMIDAALNPEGT